MSVPITDVANLINMAKGGKQRVARFITQQSNNAALNFAQQQANDNIRESGLSTYVTPYPDGQYRQLNKLSLKDLQVTALRDGGQLKSIPILFNEALKSMPQNIQLQVDRYGRVRFDKQRAQQLASQNPKLKSLYDSMRDVGSVVTQKRARKLLQSFGGKISEYPQLQYLAAYQQLMQASRNLQSYLANPTAYTAKKRLQTVVRFATQGVTKVKGMLKKLGVSPATQMSQQDLIAAMQQRYNQAAARIVQSANTRRAQWDSSLQLAVTGNPGAGRIRPLPDLQIQEYLRAGNLQNIQDILNQEQARRLQAAQIQQQQQQIQEAPQQNIPNVGQNQGNLSMELANVLEAVNNH